MNREDVIREIVERDIHNLPLSEEAVKRDAKLLLAAACEQFGTWETALTYAGVNVRRVAVVDEYSPERVLQKIRNICRLGNDLSGKRNERRDRRLCDAARQYFGSWRLALRAAGIDLNRVVQRSKPRRLDRQQIVAALRERQAAGRSLCWSQVCLEDHDLATGAAAAFHGWRRALVAAGLAPEESVTPGGVQWDREQVIVAIQARHREGKPVTATATRQDDRPLAAAVRRYFRDWREAVMAAGLEPEKCGPKGAGK